MDEESKEKLFGLLKNKWFEYTDEKKLKSKIRKFFIYLASFDEDGHAKRWCEYENPRGASTITIMVLKEQILPSNTTTLDVTKRV